MIRRFPLSLLPLVILGLCACSPADPTEPAKENAPAGSSASAVYTKDGYRFLPAAGLKAMLDDKQPVSLVDIQVEEEFAQHSIPNAIATYSYPVKSDAEKGKLDTILGQLQGEQPIVVICPRGGSGAKRCVDHLASKGIAAERLLILEDGQAKWPYAEYTEKR